MDTMKKMRFEKKFYFYMLFPFLMMVLTIILNLHFVSTYEPNKQINSFTNALDLYNDSGKIKTGVSLPSPVHYPADDEVIILKGTVPQYQKAECYITSLIRDSSIQIYIDGELRYDFDPTTGLKTKSKLVSGHLVALKLAPADFGKPLKIRLDPTVAFSKYYNAPEFFYGVGYSAQSIAGQDVTNILFNFSIFLCITLALIFYCTILIKTKRMEAIKKALTFMLFYINTFLLFSIFSSRAAFIFFQSPYFVGQVILILSAILPFSFYSCIKNLYKQDIKKGYIEVTEYTIWPLLTLYFVSFIFGWDKLNRSIILFIALTIIYIVAMIAYAVMKLDSVPPYFKFSVLLIAIAFFVNLFDYYYPQYSRFALMSIKQAVPSISAILLVTYTISNYFEENNILLKKHVLKDLAYKDALSGVYNRQAYDRRIDQMVNGRYYYIMIDINNMKSINDEQGHARGDEAIKLLGAVIISMLEKNSACYRIGGDEFAIIAPKNDIPNIEAFISDISINYFVKSDSSFTLSIGYAVIDDENGKTIEDAFKAADKKMYMEKNRFHSKENGGKK